MNTKIKMSLIVVGLMGLLSQSVFAAEGQVQGSPEKAKVSAGKTAAPREQVKEHKAHVAAHKAHRAEPKARVAEHRAAHKSAKGRKA